MAVPTITTRTIPMMNATIESAVPIHALNDSQYGAAYNASSAS